MSSLLCHWHTFTIRQFLWISLSEWLRLCSYVTRPQRGLSKDQRIMGKWPTQYLRGNQSRVIPGRRQQICATIIVNVSSILCGLAYGWTAAMIPLLCEENNEAGIEPLTTDQFSWAVSAITFGPLLILPFAGSFSEKFGRKTIIICMALPILACWIMRLLATSFHGILISQLLSGIFDGLCSFCIPIYITETVSDSIRGELGSYFTLTLEIGTLFGYIASTLISYRTYTIISLILSIIFFLGLLFIPETPVYLVRKRRIKEAFRSLMWLRGNDKVAVADELCSLQKFYSEESEKNKSANLIVLFKDRASWKGLLMGLGIIVGDQTCGMTIISMYTVTIFALTKTTMDPHIASIWYGFSQVLGVIVSTLTVESLGRRRLLFMSSVGMGITHFTLGVFLLLQYSGYNMLTFNWLPILAISAFGFTYNCGIGSVVFILPNELYNADLISICCTISMLLLYTIAALTSKLFPMLVDTLGLHTCFFMFLLSCVYIFLLTLILPETKGKSIEGIRKELCSSKKVLKKYRKQVI